MWQRYGTTIFIISFLLLLGAFTGCARRNALEPLDFGRTPPQRKVVARPLAPPQPSCALAAEPQEIATETPSIWPVNRDVAKVISRFGARRSRGGGGGRTHRGVDLKAPRGTPIHAAADGTVVLAGRQRGYGNVVAVSHGRHKTVYGHLYRIEVKCGQEVKQGDVLGTVGATGNATTTHLHYEVHEDGAVRNPEDYLP